MNEIKCAVFALNAGGEPDLFFCQVNCSEDQYRNGEHYSRAKYLAEENGYDPFLACDENDPAGDVLQLIDWAQLPENQIVSI